MLVEADHVLKLVNERDGNLPAHLIHRERTCELALDVGHDGIEHFRLIRPRVADASRIDVEG